MTGEGIGALVAAVILGLPAAAYAALRVIRRDSREDSALAVVERSLSMVEKDRDYWHAQAERERTTAEEIEQRLMARMSRASELAAEERRKLYGQIEDLRRELQRYTLRKDP